jgi:molybdopterin-guanine dinucleotide biosynthesis protein A
MKKPITGVILAGGLNSRFNGINKAFIEIDGQTILQRQYRLLRELFDEVIIVTNDPQTVLEFDCLVAVDLFSNRASLTGIHTGLFYASNDHVFICACDTPFLKRALVETITDATHMPTGVTMPATSAGLEPLCAVYAKKCLPLVERHVSQNQMKIQRVFGKKRIRLISEQKLRRADPELVSFFNINRPEDLELARQMCLGGEGLTSLKTR